MVSFVQHCICGIWNLSFQLLRNNIDLWLLNKIIGCENALKFSSALKIKGSIGCLYI